MPRIIYFALIIAAALLVVYFVRSVWDRYDKGNDEKPD
jgi:TRAP-type C4-dicarboxylate transport system permease small subunit